MKSNAEDNIDEGSRGRKRKAVSMMNGVAVKRRDNKENRVVVYENHEDDKLKLIVRPVMGQPLFVTIPADNCLGQLREVLGERLRLDSSRLKISKQHDGSLLTNDGVALGDLGVVDGMMLDVTVPVSAGLTAPTMQKEKQEGVVIMMVDQAVEPEVKIIILGPAKRKKEQAPVDLVTLTNTALHLSCDKPETEIGTKKLENETKKPETTINKAVGADIFKPAASMPATASCCHACGVRLRLAMRFTCKCERVFCATHRYHDQHDCTFDYRQRDLALLAASMPACLPSRIR